MSGDSSSARYAIYYAPPADHKLTRAAAHWLEGAASDEDRAAVAEPRRYGFHATLKAPFRLANGFAVADLEEGLRDFAAAADACLLGRLHVSLLGSFFALVPARMTPALLTFAGQIVETFDRFRAPLNEAELHRRRQSRLDAVETALLTRWGYPYVFDRFRFHLSLTGRTVPDSRASLLARLEQKFDPLLDGDFAIDALTLFEEEYPGADFTIRARFPLRAGERS